MKKGLVKIFELKNIISIKDFKKSDIDYILNEASTLENVAQSKEISEELKGKILGLMFFEPSTRTKMSFETAMKRLSGQCIGFENTGSSSVSKGESIADTAKMYEGYCDALVIRHELEGVSKFISDVVDVPVINAGDGAGQHPTQTLLDLYTIKKEIGSIDNLKIALEIIDINDVNEQKKRIEYALKAVSLGGQCVGIKAKNGSLVGNMASQGTTPRQLTDLIGSLCDLTSGSGDKGTPVILIQGYFDNYTNE